MLTWEYHRFTLSSCYLYENSKSSGEPSIAAHLAFSALSGFVRASTGVTQCPIFRCRHPWLSAFVTPMLSNTLDTGPFLNDRRAAGGDSGIQDDITQQHTTDGMLQSMDAVAA